VPRGGRVSTTGRESVACAVMESAPVADLSVDTAAVTAGGCPFPHQALGVTSCPITATAGVAGERSRADLIARRLLRVPDLAAPVSAARAQSTFQKSMLISATRCTLTYVVFPFVAPAIGFATGVGPWVGLLIGTVAIVCDVFTVRRFFAADHKWRWPFTAVAGSVIVLLAVLLVQDISHIAERLVQ
jgi:hypothetical protein